MKNEAGKVITGVSYRAGSGGFSNLWDCMFGNVRCDSFTGLPMIILGGWRDDLECDRVHHIQQIANEYPPPPDVEALSFPRSYPRGQELLLRQGFVATDALFHKESRVLVGQPRQLLEYPDSERVFTMQRLIDRKERRCERFDCVVAAWLADGRIFASDASYVEQILNLGRRAGVISHEGGGRWPSLLDAPEA